LRRTILQSALLFLMDALTFIIICMSFEFRAMSFETLVKIELHVS